MPARGHAVLHDRDGHHALVFERRLAHPPQRVWQALVGYEELAQWHPTPFVLGESQPAAGEPVRYRPLHASPAMPHGRLLEFEPPRLLAYTWGDDQLRWELREDGSGCVLTLTHSFNDRFKAARDAAGWHLCLDALSSWLQGSSRPSRGATPRLPDGWCELNRDYQQRFGIPAAAATPPPA